MESAYYFSILRNEIAFNIIFGYSLLELK